MAREGMSHTRALALKSYIRNTLVHLAEALRHRAIVRTEVGTAVRKAGRNGVAEMRVTGVGSSAVATNAVLGVTSSNNLSRNQPSQVCGVSKTSIGRCRSLSASIYMALQSQALSHFSSAWAAVANTTRTTTTPPTLLSMSVARFDETSERLSLPIGNQMEPRQQMSSWHVLVCRRAGVGRGLWRVAQVLGAAHPQHPSHRRLRVASTAACSNTPWSPRQSPLLSSSYCSAGPWAVRRFTQWSATAPRPASSWPRTGSI